MPFSIFNEFAGSATGGYDTYASLPTDIGWSRQSRFTIPLCPKVLWKNQIVDSSPDSSTFCVDRNRNALIAINDTSFLNEAWGKIIKISHTGHIDELFHAEHRLYNITLIRDGNILCILHHITELKLICLSSEGKFLWEFLFKSDVKMRPVLDEDGNIYLYAFSNKTGTLFCLQPDGILKWKKDFPSMCWHEPVISKNGIIYLGLNQDHCLYTMDSAGNMLWSKTIGVSSRPPFLIKSDGTLYIVVSDALNSFSNSLSAISPFGEIVWQYRIAGSCNLSKGTALDSTGNLYFNTTQFELVSVNSDGMIRWKSKISGSAIAPPVIGANGILYQLSWLDTPRQYTSFLEVYHANTGEKLWSQTFNGFINSAVLAGNDMLYLLTSMENRSNGKLHESCEFYIIGDAKQTF